MKEPVMPKYPRTFLPVVVALFASSLAVAAEPAEKPDDRAIYDRIVSLAGDWTGHMEDPLAGPPVAVRYEVASNGHAVVEFQNTGQSFETVTVYFLAGGKLHATHYSAAGNQPAYKPGGESTADLVLLEFDGGTGFDADHDGHVHQGEIRFVSPDRIEQRWFHYVGPKEQGVTHWFLERKAAEEKPAAEEPKPEPVAEKKR
jgi:S-formylglutathione hydrolase FrmB